MSPLRSLSSTLSSIRTIFRRWRRSIREGTSHMKSIYPIWGVSITSWSPLVVDLIRKAGDPTRMKGRVNSLLRRVLGRIGRLKDLIGISHITESRANIITWWKWISWSIRRTSAIINSLMEPRATQDPMTIPWAWTASTRLSTSSNYKTLSILDTQFQTTVKVVIISSRGCKMWLSCRVISIRSKKWQRNSARAKRLLEMKAQLFWMTCTLNKSLVSASSELHTRWHKCRSQSKRSVWKMRNNLKNMHKKPDLQWPHWYPWWAMRAPKPIRFKVKIHRNWEKWLKMTQSRIKLTRKERINQMTLCRTRATMTTA